MNDNLRDISDRKLEPPHDEDHIEDCEVWNDGDCTCDEIGQSAKEDIENHRRKGD